MMLDLDLVTYISYISAKNHANFKNYTTFGKDFSRPTKPDQPRLYSFSRLEVMVFIS